MPVVIGQPIDAPCFLARAVRISLIVVSSPEGTFLISSSTSVGAGITTVPVPHLLLILSVIFSTFGRPLLSCSFSDQLILTFLFDKILPSQFRFSVLLIRLPNNACEA